MHYVVMDLEWNQAMSSKSSVFNKLPIHLRALSSSTDWNFCSGRKNL